LSGPSLLTGEHARIYEWGESFDTAYENLSDKDQKTIWALLKKGRQ